MKKLLLIVPLALGVLLFAEAPQASASSPFDSSAYEDLATGSQYAIDAYDANPDDPDAYYAALCGDYAQYYASIAYSDDDQASWYDAYLYGSYAADFALASYEATGNGSSYAAYFYFSSGSSYAYDAYVNFE